MKRRKRTLGLSPISQLHSPSDFQSLALLPSQPALIHSSLQACLHHNHCPSGGYSSLCADQGLPFMLSCKKHKGLKCLKEGNCPRWEPCEQAKGLGFLLSAGKEWQLNTELQRV